MSPPWPLLGACRLSTMLGEDRFHSKGQTTSLRGCKDVFDAR